MPHDGSVLFTCQSSCALPASSTYSKLDLQPVGLLVTNSPFESAAQSTEEKALQFFNTISRVGWPAIDSRRMRLSPELVTAISFPSGERLQFMFPVGSCSLVTS